MLGERMKVGHFATSIVDRHRDGRALTVDLWFPTADEGDTTTYTLLPGIDLPSEASVESARAASGQFPLIVWSHGRTGQRHNYTLLCEGLAARGFIVVSADHAGDTLTDWLSGTNVDDETNERLRLGDVAHLVETVAFGADRLPADIARAVDRDRIHVAGHSYGGLTAIVSTTGIHGVPPVPHVRSIAAAQAYTRTLPASVIGSIDVPLLLLVASGDSSTPAVTDADPIWNAIVGRHPGHRRVDLPDSGHQACSDFALYMELVPSIPGVPTLVLDYLTSIANESPAGFAASWRTTVVRQIDEIASFFAAS